MALESDPLYLKRMKEFAVTDANHDFGPSFKKRYDGGLIDVGTPEPRHNPKPLTDAWSLLSSYTTNSINFTGLQLNQPIKAVSVTGHNYDICAFNAKDLENIMPFLYNVDKSVDLQGMEANLIIDGLATSFWKDVRETKGKSLGRLNILTNRETVNDPGSRPAPNDVLYEKNQDRAVELYSYQDATEEDIVYPEWQNPRIDYRNDFFSNYALKLSKVNIIDTSETSHMSFLLKDVAIQDGSYIVTNSTDAVNSVEAVKVKLDAPTLNKNNFGLLLQQKRSGDSLQTLSTLDKTRLYKQRTGHLLAAPLMTLSSTYTYAVSHDIWNCSYGILMGASLVILTATNNTLIVCRTGIPRNPVDIFREQGPLLIQEHNTNVTSYTTAFNLVATPQVNKYVDLLEQLENFINTELIKDVMSSKAEQIRIEDTLNRLLKELISFSIPIAFLFTLFAPKKPLEMPIDINPITVGEIMNTIRSQAIIQSNPDILFSRLLSSMKSINMANDVLFFNSSGEGSVSYKALMSFFGTMSLIVKIKMDIIDKTYQLIKNIADSNYIQGKYTSSIQRPGFDIVFQIFLSAYEDIHDKKEAKRQRRSISEETSYSKSISEIRDNMYNKILMNVKQNMVLIENKLKGIENGPMTGGENEPIRFLTGENLVNRLLNKTLIPCAADILELNKKETAYESQLLVKYILIGLLKFLSYQPPYESADHISKWGPVFFEMMLPILEDKEEETRRMKLKFFLGIWLTEDPLKNINITMDESIEDWSDLSKEAGHVLLDFIFGSDAYSIFGNLEPFAITYNLNIISYKESYNNSYMNAKKLVEDFVLEEPKPALIETTTLMKGLSEPTSQTITVVDSSPSLVPGSFTQSSATTQDPVVSSGESVKSQVMADEESAKKQGQAATQGPQAATQGLTIGGKSRNRITKKMWKRKGKALKHKRRPTRRHFEF
jgi:hypothetical protein